MAVTGLLTGSQSKRAGGLSGWMGQMAANPITAKIQELIRTPTTREEPTYGLPSRAQTGFIPTLPAQEGSLAQPAEAATQGGPVTAPQPSPTPPSAARMTEQGRPVIGTQPVSVPRTIFMSPEQALEQHWTGEERGQILGTVAAYEAVGVPHEEAVQRAIEERRRRAGMGIGSVQSIAGELPDGTPAFGVFDRMPGSPTYGRYIDPETHEPLEGFRPRTTTGSTSLGADRESISRELFGKRASQLTPPEMAVVNERLTQFGGERAAATTTARGAAAAAIPLTKEQALTQARGMLPNGTLEQQTALADALMQGSAAPAGAPAPAAAAPAPAPATVGAPPPGLSTTPEGAAAAAPTVGQPPAAAAPARKPGLGSAIPSELSGATKQTGKPLPTAVTTAVANAKATNDLIDEALAALAPFKDDNTEEGGMKLAQQYRQGIFDPERGIVAQLADLSGLTAASRAQISSGASRSIQVYRERRSHTPRLPSVEAAEWSTMLPSGIVGKVSRLRGGGWDSPQLMYQKLQQIKQAGELFIKEMESEAAAGTPMRTPNALGTPPPGAVQNPRRDAQGNWVIDYPK